MYLITSTQHLEYFDDEVDEIDENEIDSFEEISNHSECSSFFEISTTLNDDENETEQLECFPINYPPRNSQFIMEPIIFESNKEDQHGDISNFIKDNNNNQPHYNNNVNPQFIYNELDSCTWNIQQQQQQQQKQKQPISHAHPILLPSLKVVTVTS
ncbi:hypothetical protein PPL_11440 [Heterostelium album PN500]|uniref:Uncharacterized protein n=1 Tax=Heterostelium pallidum (strain ATCC 26659 / Pp 5 / PN500) TaxID=670386 RepID=D3BTE6_HETP5|nr:hypothetical protein PPL_11440 [Heterostelium album PN500]EFA75363.1 hypothetical protein PPL_11440 [Heterostelium album PN500]|eukprot:XP_020427497.1 hypothetical protein PPL_11440 [Heterostelium album PN500]